MTSFDANKADGLFQQLLKSEAHDYRILVPVIVLPLVYLLEAELPGEGAGGGVRPSCLEEDLVDHVRAHHAERLGQERLSRALSPVVGVYRDVQYVRLPVDDPEDYVR